MPGDTADEIGGGEYHHGAIFRDAVSSNSVDVLAGYGGGYGSRTHDLLNAIHYTRG